MDDDVGAVLEQLQDRLDSIEEHVVEMSQYGAPILAAAQGRADHRPTDLSHVPEEVVALARAGTRRDAIVKSRGLIDADPKYAASIVDSRP